MLLAGKWYCALLLNALWPLYAKAFGYHALNVLVLFQVYALPLLYALHISFCALPLLPTLRIELLHVALYVLPLLHMLLVHIVRYTTLLALLLHALYMLLHELMLLHVLLLHASLHASLLQLYVSPLLLRSLLPALLLLHAALLLLHGALLLLHGASLLHDCCCTNCCMLHALPLMLHSLLMLALQWLHAALLPLHAELALHALLPLAFCTVRCCSGFLRYLLRYPALVDCTRIVLGLSISTLRLPSSSSAWSCHSRTPHILGSFRFLFL